MQNIQSELIITVKNYINITSFNMKGSPDLGQADEPPKLSISIQTNGIAFSVGLQYDPANLTKGDTIIFDWVKTNIRNHYDKRTGLFRPLVAGVYVFYVNAMSLDSQWVELRIMKNDEALVRTYSHASSTFRDNSGNMVVAQLKVGDDVYVQVSRSDSNVGMVLDDFATTFSGFLLFRTN